MANSSSTNDDTTSTGSSRGRTGDSFESTTDRTTNGETETTTDSGSTERSYETNTEEDMSQTGTRAKRTACFCSLNVCGLQLKQPRTWPN
ncbi:MAG: hypothetical protein NTW52_13680 [Planctomycetota bacterium]|nr:hypothetical protein [Planctomycetota bacterium]